MKKLNIKNQSIRKDIKKFEQKKFILKTIIKNTNLFYLIRWKANSFLKNLRKTTSKTLITNRCIFSERKKRLNKIINVSRLVFLNFVRLTEINGIKKAVW